MRLSCTQRVLIIIPARMQRPAPLPRALFPVPAGGVVVAPLAMRACGVIVARRVIVCP